LAFSDRLVFTDIGLENEFRIKVKSNRIKKVNAVRRGQVATLFSNFLSLEQEEFHAFLLSFYNLAQSPTSPANKNTLPAAREKKDYERGTGGVIVAVSGNREGGF
jgi:hypothetical protein